jgi:hypothetical protein
MGFSVKMAPGVRVRASSRGLRTSVGPRIARVHVGAGRTGLSTGAGPVGFYTSAGGSRGAGSSSQGSAAVARQLDAANKAQEAEELAQVLLKILRLHRQEFPTSHPPEALDVSVDEAEIYERHHQQALTGVGRFARKERAQAKERASVAARTEIKTTRAHGEAQRAALQTELDEAWQRLLANDPETVIGTLAEAFEDNEAAAAPVGVTANEVSIVVLVPNVDAVPDRRPTTTAAGNLSLKKLTKRESTSFYTLVVVGHVLATLKEAFAVAPSIESGRIIAIRPTGINAYGAAQTECVLATRVTRDALKGILWADVDAATVLNDAQTDLLVNPKGVNQELTAIPLAAEPDIAAVLAAVDMEGLLESR